MDEYGEVGRRARRAMTARTIKYRRGKPIPPIKHGDLVDYTTWPLHSKPNGRPIERCPECGRKGEMRTYRTGAKSFTHLTRFETIFWMVKDSHTIGSVV